jgi:hypothetical protein
VFATVHSKTGRSPVRLAFRTTMELSKSRLPEDGRTPAFILRRLALVYGNIALSATLLCGFSLWSEK